MTSDTLLLRQINPSWVQLGRVTSQAFKPTVKDFRRLSVYDGDLIAPQDAWTHYTKDMECSSLGVLAVSVSDCRSVALPAEPDPELFPEHVAICFDACTNSQVDKKAKCLKRAAESRGWQYQPEAEDQ